MPQRHLTQLTRLCGESWFFGSTGRFLELPTQRAAVGYSTAGFVAVLGTAFGAVHYLAKQTDKDYVIAEKEYMDEIADVCDILLFGGLVGVLVQQHNYMSRLETDTYAALSELGNGFPGFSIQTTVAWALSFLAGGVAIAKYMLPDKNINRWAVTDFTFHEHLDEVSDVVSVLTIGTIVAVAIYHTMMTNMVRKAMVAHQKELEAKLASMGGELPPGCPQS